MNKRKKSKRVTMVIGIASLVVAFVLLGVVFAVASFSGPEDSYTGAVGVSASDTAESASGESEGSEGSTAGGGSTAGEFSGKNSVKTNQLPDSSFLYDTDIAELAKADTFNDGQRVQIQGEVVGDAIVDESSADHYWITVQDANAANPSSIEVLISQDALSAIDSFGKYGQRGSMVQVRGTYQLACADHQGLSDIHADEVQVLSQGEVLEEPVNSVVLTSAVIAVCLGGALLVLYHVRRERMR